MPKYIPFLCAVLFWACATSVATSAQAQSSQFSPDRMKIVPGRTAFTPLAKTSFDVGDRLALDIAASPAARKLFADGFQARVFRLPTQNGLPERLAFFDPCEIYLSTIFRFDPNTTSQAEIGRLGRDWLDLRPDGARTAYYLLVVEQGAPGDDAILRLDVRQKSEYFNSGVRFAVSTPVPLTGIELQTMLTGGAASFAQVLERGRRNQRDLKCFTLEARYRSDEEELLAYLQPPCSDYMELPSVY